MSTFTLTLIDTVGIQNYIFNSNILKHNVGGSELVRLATRDWVYEELNKLGPTNISPHGNINDLYIEQQDKLFSELIYAGGGNTVILFRSLDIAREFTRCFTRDVLTKAPGLQLVVVHQEFNWETDALSKVLKKIVDKANHKKRNYKASSRHLGLSVTADCQYTGLPAVALNRDRKRIAAEIRAKEQIFDAAHCRFIKVFSLNEEYDIPKDFDEFGRTKGEASYIAVVHTDGNKIGQRMAAIADQYPNPEDNRNYILKMRSFSQSIEMAAAEALKATFQQLVGTIDEEGKIGGVILLPERDGKKLIPFRPIVWGGDDITFVCDGRLGLTLSAFYLKKMTERPLADGQPLSMRAGIAIVKTHYPFARAYALAEELIRSAKEYLRGREVPPFNEQNLTAMDWHFAISGAVVGLKEIRQREYTVPTGSLIMRPIRLGPATATDWHSWEVFKELINGFRSEKWETRRNKLLALRQILRDGPEVVEHFLKVYGLPDLPCVEHIPNLAKKTGWVEGHCVYFDAIEALEFFVPIDGGEG